MVSVTYSAMALKAGTIEVQEEYSLYCSLRFSINVNASK